MANQSDRRDGHNFNSNAAMQKPKVEADKNKNPQYKGNPKDSKGKSGKDGCC